MSDDTVCRSCPVCQGLAMLREADPDAVRRLELASLSLVAAVRELFTGSTDFTGRPSPDQPSQAASPAPVPGWQSIEIGE